MIHSKQFCLTLDWLKKNGGFTILEMLWGAHAPRVRRLTPSSTEPQRAHARGRAWAPAAGRSRQHARARALPVQRKNLRPLRSLREAKVFPTA